MLLQHKRIGQCSLSELRCGSGSGSIAAVPAVVAVKLRKTSDGGGRKTQLRRFRRRKRACEQRVQKMHDEDT